MKVKRVLPCLALALAASTLDVRADEAKPVEQPTPPAAQAAPKAPVATSAMVIYRDPKTGELRAPTAKELEELMAAAQAQDDTFSRSDVGLVETHYDNGTVGINLEGRFQSATILQLAADGNAKATCTHDAKTAATLLAKPAVEEARDEQ